RRLRSTGRVSQLESLVDESRVTANIGIAHTRWATHGAPSEANAHPHISGYISVVHNGIIENHEAMRAELMAAGYCFTSDTDSEVIAHLVRHEVETGGGGLLAAVRRAARRLEG